jgi:hypothetical protein
MSTTSDIAVAASYSVSGASLLFKLKVNNFMQFGVSRRPVATLPGLPHSRVHASSRHAAASHPPHVRPCPRPRRRWSPRPRAHRPPPPPPLPHVAVPCTQADLQWLSAFPGEAEILFPPLTYLQPTGRIERVKLLEGSVAFTIVEVEPHIS